MKIGQLLFPHQSDFGERGRLPGLLIVDIFQEALEEQITEAVVLAPGEVILFFG